MISNNPSPDERARFTPEQMIQLLPILGQSERRALREVVEGKLAAMAGSENSDMRQFLERSLAQLRGIEAEDASILANAIASQYSGLPNIGRVLTNAQKRYFAINADTFAVGFLTSTLRLLGMKSQPPWAEYEDQLGAMHRALAACDADLRRNGPTYIEQLRSTAALVRIQHYLVGVDAAIVSLHRLVAHFARGTGYPKADYKRDIRLHEDARATALRCSADAHTVLSSLVT